MSPSNVAVLKILIFPLNEICWEQTHQLQGTSLLSKKNVRETNRLHFHFCLLLSLQLSLLTSTDLMVRSWTLSFKMLWLWQQGLLHWALCPSSIWLLHLSYRSVHIYVCTRCFQPSKAFNTCLYLSLNASSSCWCKNTTSYLHIIAKETPRPTAGKGQHQDSP